jgi:hypothetical protein
MRSMPSMTEAGGAEPDEAANLAAETAVRFTCSIDQHVVDDRGAAHVGDAIFTDCLEDQLRVNPPDTDIRSGDGRHRPGKAPSIAVEHGQRPKIDRVCRHGPGYDVRQSVQVCSAVMRDHALGVARGARGIVQRDGLPLVFRQGPGEIGIAFLQERFVVLLSEQGATCVQLVIDVDY